MLQLLFDTRTGFVQFLGNSHLNTKDFVGDAIDITVGTLRLAKDDAGFVSFDASSSTASNGGNFNVGSSAKLKGQGTVSVPTGTVTIQQKYAVLKKSAAQDPSRNLRYRNEDNP